MSIKTLKSIQTSDNSVILDLVYDYYGRRLAAASSNHKIMIWDLDENQEWSLSSELEWELSSEWRAHNGSVLKIDWAAPEFGQVIASCSFDKKIRIWEENQSIDSPSKKSWVIKADLNDSQGFVNAIKFSPSHLGLKLASGGEDGKVRIYEANDITDIAQWQISEQFDASDNATRITCLSWCTSPFHSPLLAVGLDDKKPKIWRLRDKGRWEVVCTLEGHTDSIHDIAWAPSMGRSYELIATASKDKTVIIWTIRRNKETDNYECIHSETLEHSSEVWKVEWNITGTILASSDNDNNVKLWKPKSYSSNWTCINIIKGAE